MRVAIDGYEANAEARVGIGRYAFELLSAIARRQAGSNAPFDDVRVYLPEPVRPHMPKPGAKWHYRSLSPKQLWTMIGLPLALFRDRPRADVIFSPTHYIPRWVTIPRVMAIMDLSYLTYPELFRSEDLHKLIHWTAYSVRHAAKIITISEFSKHAIIDEYRLPENMVVVAYPALSDAVTKLRMKRTKVSLVPKRYILSVGTLQPRKNFTRLIEAVSLLTDKEIELIIVGKRGWLYDEIFAAPKKFGVGNRVHFLEYVSDDELASLYQHAACFVLPSLYEGFGLPVLEAMAHGTTVVLSKRSSLPEIAGDAGIYVKPEDTESIARGITLALSEKAIDRSKRIAIGKKRVGEFTWDKAAEKVIDVLKEVGMEKEVNGKV